MKYILFAFVEGCSERCADATIEDISPLLKTMLYKDFLKEYRNKK